MTGWSSGPSEREVVDTGSWAHQEDQGDGWDTDAVVMSQAGGSGRPTFVQQTPMMTGGPVYITQPTLQGTPVVVQASLARQSDSRYGMAAATVRRF